MKNKNWSLIVLVSMLSVSAWAGEKVGNGGKVVACPDRPLEVLDYHRATPEFGLVPVTSAPGNNEFVQAEAIVGRIAFMNPTRAAMYVESIRSFRAESLFLPDSEFPTSNDTSEVAFCRDGRILQVITQRKPMTVFEKRYLVNADIWNRMPIFQRAVLLVHEAALKEALNYNYVTADGAARMNALILARDLPRFTRAQIDEVMVSTGLLYLNDRELRNNTITQIVNKVMNFKRFGTGFEVIVPFASLDYFPQTPSPDGFYLVPEIGRIFEYVSVNPIGGRDESYLSALGRTKAARGMLQFSINIHEQRTNAFSFYPLNGAGDFIQR